MKTTRWTAAVAFLALAAAARADLPAIREAQARRALAAREREEARRMMESRRADRRAAREALAALESSRAEAAATLARLAELRSRRAAISAEIADTHRRYSSDPRNEALYERLQALRAEHAANDRSLGEVRLREDEAGETLARAERERPNLEARIAEAERREAAFAPDLRRAEEAARRADEEVHRLLAADPSSRDLAELDRSVRTCLDHLLNLGGPAPSGPGSSRSFSLLAEGTGEFPLEMFGLPGSATLGGEHEIVLSREDDGTYTITTVTEVALGGKLDGEYGILSGELQLSAGNRVTIRQKFDPARTGDITRAAIVLMALGDPSLSAKLAAADAAIDTVVDAVPEDGRWTVKALGHALGFLDREASSNPVYRVARDRLVAAVKPVADAMSGFRDAAGLPATDFTDLARIDFAVEASGGGEAEILPPEVFGAHPILGRMMMDFRAEARGEVGMGIEFRPGRKVALVASVDGRAESRGDTGLRGAGLTVGAVAGGRAELKFVLDRDSRRFEAIEMVTSTNADFSGGGRLSAPAADYRAEATNGKLTRESIRLDVREMGDEIETALAPRLPHDRPPLPGVPPLDQLPLFDRLLEFQIRRPDAVRHAKYEARSNGAKASVEVEHLGEWGGRGFFVDETLVEGDPDPMNAHALFGDFDPGAG